MTLVLGLFFALAAAFWQAADNARTAQLRFDALAEDAAERLAVRLRTYEYALRGARGMALANGPGLVGSQPYARYVASLDLAARFPGMRDLGMVWRVPRDAAAEAAFVARIRNDGDPGFRIRELQPHAGDRYLTAFDGKPSEGRAPIGFDLASEPNRLQVAETAMRTGLPSLSAPVPVLGKTGPPQHSFLLMLPIYRDGAPVATEGERTAATVGWIATALLTEQALASLGLDDDQLTMSLRDAAGAAAAPFFFSTPGAETAAAGGLTRRIELPVYGRVWQIDLRARPRFLQELRLPDPRVIAAFGSVLAAALASLMHTLALGRRREHQVHSEQARRAAIVDGSHDAIICQALDGTITDWNAGAERLFGHPAKDVIGIRLAPLLMPPGQEPGNDREGRSSVDTTAVTAVAFDTVRRHADGTLLDVSLSTSPIVGAAGECIGIATTLRDISAARRAAELLQEANASLEGRVAERTALLEAARRDLQAILDALPTAIAYWDRTLHSRFRNRAHRLWFGSGQAVEDDGRGEGGPGLHISELFGPGYADRAPEVESALAGEARVRERRSTDPRGRIPLHTVNHYLPDVRDGEVHGFYVMGHDVTAAKLAEERLRSSEEFLDRAGEIAGVGGWALDLRTMALTWSAHTYRIHEVDRGQQPDVAGAIEFYPPEVRPVISRAVEQGIADGTPWDLELPFITARGRRIWVRAQGTADLEDGRPVRLIGAFQDITERKRAAARLEQAHDRFAIAADSAHIGVWEYDPVGETCIWDERMYRLFGHAPSEPAEALRLWQQHIHPDDRERCEALRARALRGEARYEVEYRVVWPSGEVRHLRASGRVIRDEEGRPVRMTGVKIDITEQKRAQLDLTETSSLLHTVLDSASEVSIIAGDPSMRITVFNRGAERLLGYQAAEVIGRTGAELRIHDKQEVAARAEELSEELGEPVRGVEVFTHAASLGQPREWTYRRKDGRQVQVSLIVTAMRDTSGGLLGYLGIAHDVTRQKQHEASLREAMNKARHASLAKSQFLANVSHEIRTPMNAVIGLTYLLGQSALDAQQADMVAKLRIAGKGLLGIINDVLDLSKIEANELTLERAPFTLRSVLSDLSALTSVQAGAKGIRFSVDAPASLPLVLDGDATRLGQILTNLVTNAVKFTERGGVKLSVGLRGDAAAAGAAGSASSASASAAAVAVAVAAGDGDGNRPRVARMRFTVRDSGIGIPQELQSRLFAPFVQADASTKRRFGGTGLGLSIVKRLVTLMGGTVWMESLAGVGSTFWVDIDLPVLDVSTTEHAALATPQARSLQGMRILLTDDSDINLEVAGRILMRHGANITLAHDGQQAVDLLRQRPDGFDIVLMDVQMPVLDGHEATQRIRHELGLRDLPVIALTAGAFTAENETAGAAGMNDFIRKPFDAHGLVRTVLRHVRPHAAQPAALGTTAWGGSSTAWGGPASDWGSPATAADSISAARDHISPAGNHISPAGNAASSAGAGPAGAGSAASAGSGGDSAGASFGQVGDGWPEIDGIDRADVRARLGGDLGLFASMLQRLLREFTDIGQALAASGDIEPQALAALGARMHKLKGSASTLGATAIGRLADRTEAACRAHQGERARQTTLELASQLKTLAASAGSVLDELRAGSLKTASASLAPASAAAAAEPEQPERLVELLRLFDEQSLGALDRFPAIAPVLRQRLGERRFRHLQDHVDNLQFEEAAQMLRRLVEPPAAARA